MGRLTKLIVLALCATALAAVPALAAISGPKTIKPGKKASFAVTGAGAGKSLTVKLVTNGKSGVIFRQKPVTDSKGGATVSFRVPQRYNVKLNCNSVYAECTTKAWTDGQKATLKVCPTGRGCQSKALTVRKR
jgi:hypothetical protein